MRKYDFAVVIGRFQPPHNGHKYLIEEALKIAENVIVLVGSAKSSVSIKNPFTFKDRELMIRNMMNLINDRLIIKPLKDFIYNDELWVQEVQRVVASELDRPTDKVVLVGHTKDESSFYLKMFPQWSYEEIPINERLNATDVRDLLFKGHSISYLRGVVPDSVFSTISSMSSAGSLDDLFDEYQYIQEYKKSWAVAPYPPTFVTADAVVIQQGHILVIKRGMAPGKGLYALPGGFVNQGEFIRDAAIRELREETKLKVPEPVLRGSIVAEKVFDAPNRSLRGRTITQAFLIHLTNIDQGLPKVKGSDDAAEAMFIPLAELKEEEFFEDHFHIIQTMVGLL